MMMKMQRGQTTLELAAMLVVVIAAILAMVFFLKRSMMGKLRETGTQMGEQFTPLDTANNYVRTYNSSQEENLTEQGATTTNNINAVQDRTGSEYVAPLGNENLW